MTDCGLEWQEELWSDSTCIVDRYRKECFIEVSTESKCNICKVVIVQPRTLFVVRGPSRQKANYASSGCPITTIGLAMLISAVISCAGTMCSLSSCLKVFNFRLFLVLDKSAFTSHPRYVEKRSQSVVLLKPDCF